LVTPFVRPRHRRQGEQRTLDHVPERPSEVQLLRDHRNPNAAIAPIGQQVDAIPVVSRQSPSVAVSPIIPICASGIHDPSFR
jgi:hypothetical protein